MGLEAINFFFRSGEPIKNAIGSKLDVDHVEDGKYIYHESGRYWIDLELQDLQTVSIRITLCNPQQEVLTALHNILLVLFSSGKGALQDLNTKKVYRDYDEAVRKEIIASYEAKKKVFEEIYGNYTAAIGSEEFYERRRTNNIPPRAKF